MPEAACRPNEMREPVSRIRNVELMIVVMSIIPAMVLSKHSKYASANPEFWIVARISSATAASRPIRARLPQQSDERTDTS